MDILRKITHVDYVINMPEPAEFDFGVVYVSYKTIACLCPDGCGEYVYWKIGDGCTFDDTNGKVTLTGKQNTYCKNGTRFYINKNKIVAL